MSTFDVNTFMGTQVQGANETKYTPVPERDDYLGVITKLAGDTINQQPVLRVTYMLDDQQAREITGMQEPTVEQTVWLDLENGALSFAPNKNVALGRLREAVGQNDPAKPWSPKDLHGQVVRLSVKHRVNEENGDRFAQVKGTFPRG